MIDKNDQNRLLIATFIVATFVAVMFSNASINISSESPLFYLIGALLFGLMICAGFSFIYILTIGYLLRYSKQSPSKKLTRLSEYSYNLSVSAYIWVMLILSAAYLLKKIDDIAGGNSLYSTLIIIILGAIIFLITSWKDLTLLIKNLRSKWNSSIDS